jgi:hypothetical protein
MRDNQEIWKGWEPALNIIAAAGIVGVGATIGHEVAVQFAIAHDQKMIDQCEPLISELPTKALPMDCRNVKAAMQASQGDLINGMHNLREAYLTVGRRADEVAYIHRGTFEGAAVALALTAITGAVIFAYDSADKRWCARYSQQVYPSTLYNQKQRKMAV